LAPQHPYFADRSAEYFLKQALDMDRDVAGYINTLLASGTCPEKAYKACSGILHFHKHFGKERPVNACRPGDGLKQYGCPTIESIPKNGEDMLFEQPVNEPDEPPLPAHENIRGKEYYQ
jgi:hypothetical protein